MPLTTSFNVLSVIFWTLSAIALHVFSGFLSVVFAYTTAHASSFPGIKCKTLQLYRYRHVYISISRHHTKSPYSTMDQANQYMYSTCRSWSIHVFEENKFATRLCGHITHDFPVSQQHLRGTLLCVHGEIKGHFIDTEGQARGRSW